MTGLAEKLGGSYSTNLRVKENATSVPAETTGRILHKKHFPDHPLDNLVVRNSVLQFSSDANRTDIDEIYDEHGRFIAYGEDDARDREGNPTHYTRPVFDMRADLYERTGPIYQIIDRRLRSEKPDNGFSRHDLEGHILPTGDLIDQLLNLGEHSERIKFLVHQANMIHDLGNLTTRVGHSFESMPFAVAVAPSITQDEKGFAVTRRAVELHDEKAFSQLLSSWGSIADHERLELLRRLGEEEGLSDELPAVLAMLFLADKADVDRNRLNEAAINKQALESDPHVRVIALSKNGGFSLSPDGLTLIHRINFNPYISKEEYARLGPIARATSHHEGYRFDLPRYIHDLHRKHGIPGIYTMAADYKRTYQERITLSALMAPIAIPGVKYYALELHEQEDPDDPKVGETVVHTINPAALKRQGEIFSVKFQPKEIRKPEDYIIEE